MTRILLFVVMAGLAVGGCTIARETNPDRTATEQLLLSSAADRAAERMNLPLKPGTRVFVDASNFEGTDGKYAIAAIRDRILRGGAGLVAERANADAVVEIRAGALSIDETKTLVGIPEFDIPVPLAGSAVTFPEIALYKKAERRAIAKFAAVGYRAKDGQAIATTAPQYGRSHKTEWTVLLFISWTRNNAVPREVESAPLDVERPETPW